MDNRIRFTRKGKFEEKKKRGEFVEFVDLHEGR